MTTLSEATIRDAMLRQELPAYRVKSVIRILVSDLQEWLTQARYGSADDPGR